MPFGGKKSRSQEENGDAPKHCAERTRISAKASKKRISKRRYWQGAVGTCLLDNKVLPEERRGICTGKRRARRYARRKCIGREEIIQSSESEEKGTELPVDE